MYFETKNINVRLIQQIEYSIVISQTGLENQQQDLFEQMLPKLCIEF
jgi:hypothetical protein